MTRGLTVQRDLLRPTRRIRHQRLSKERLRRRYAAITAKQKINGLALLIHGTIELVPLASNGDVGLLHPPGRSNAARVSIPAFLILRNIPNDPSQNRRVRDLDTTLCHPRHEVSI